MNRALLLEIYKFKSTAKLYLVNYWQSFREPLIETWLLMLISGFLSASSAQIISLILMFQWNWSVVAEKSDPNYYIKLFVNFLIESLYSCKRRNMSKMVSFFTGTNDMTGFPGFLWIPWDVYLQKSFKSFSVDCFL